MSETETTKAKQKTGWLNIAVDYGPLVVFLAVYKFASPGGDAPLGQLAAVIQGTIAFMIAAVLALAFSKWKFWPRLADADALHRADCRLRRTDDLAARSIVYPDQADRDLCAVRRAADRRMAARQGAAANPAGGPRSRGSITPAGSSCRATGASSSSSLPRSMNSSGTSTTRPTATSRPGCGPSCGCSCR